VAEPGFDDVFEPEIIAVTPADANASRIGHMGFFRSEHRDPLWRRRAEWIEGG
jgi:predicted alpha/beta hydrolase